MRNASLRRLVVVWLAAIAAQPACAADPHAGPAMNYHRIDATLTTGGHFVGDGLAQLAKEGVEVVIDLRPEDADEHRASVEAAGLTYVHVPVSWTDPQIRDFKNFAESLRTHRDSHVLVQCAANYRASAMTYLYRSLVEATDRHDARGDMVAVWKPNRRWRQYIESVESAAQPEDSAGRTND